MHIKFIQGDYKFDYEEIEGLLSQQLRGLPLDEREFERRVFCLKKMVEVV